MQHGRSMDTILSSACANGLCRLLGVDRSAPHISVPHGLSSRSLHREPSSDSFHRRCSTPERASTVLRVLREQTGCSGLSFEPLSFCALTVMRAEHPDDSHDGGAMDRARIVSSLCCCCMMMIVADLFKGGTNLPLIVQGWDKSPPIVQGRGDLLYM